jgi:hypothetical protein
MDNVLEFAIRLQLKDGKIVFPSFWKATGRSKTTSIAMIEKIDATTSNATINFNVSSERRQRLVGKHTRKNAITYNTLAATVKAPTVLK